MYNVLHSSRSQALFILLCMCNSLAQITIFLFVWVLPVIFVKVWLKKEELKQTKKLQFGPG